MRTKNLVLKNIFSLVIIAIVSLVSIQNKALAQTPTKDELKEDISDLTRLDPDIEKLLPRWNVLEADLKIKIAQAFKLDGVPVRETDVVTVSATFARPNAEQQLLTIRMGENNNAIITGTQKIRGTIGEDLYQQLLSRSYALSDIEPEIPTTKTNQERMPTVLNPVNARQFISASLTRQVVQVGTSSFRLEHYIGSDEIGYPFWFGGEAKAMISYPIVPLSDPELRAKGVPDVFKASLGLAYKFKSGGEPTGVTSFLPARLLNGNNGLKPVVKFEYRFPKFENSYETGDFGLALGIETGKMKDTSTIDGSIDYARSSQLIGSTVRQVGYFAENIVQGNVFWEKWIDGYEHFVRLSLGISYQDFARGVYHITRSLPAKPIPVSGSEYADAVVYSGLIHPTEFGDWFYFKTEYLNQSGFPFSASIQLANRNLTFSGVIPVIPNWLLIEGKFSSTILGDKRPWETGSMFMVSPMLRFRID
ncbi:MAG: hypothetical protein IPP08_10800 [Chlorobiota bacterium]|nr:MAG: hypothetical protein IPP08_10800 [Chlorobiota bacterium]